MSTQSEVNTLDVNPAVVTKPAAKAKPKAAAKAKPAVKAKPKAAAKAKPKAAAKDGEDTRLVPANLEAYTVDKEIKTAAGNPSVHCGDAIAKQLLGKTLDEVYSIASKKLNETVKDLKAKYQHLNLGMQRMNLGNRLRKA